MKQLKVFLGGLLAGISISIGGTVFLSLENKVLGALFFVGLADWEKYFAPAFSRRAWQLTAFCCSIFSRAEDRER